VAHFFLPGLACGRPNGSWRFLDLVFPLEEWSFKANLSLALSSLWRRALWLHRICTQSFLPSTELLDVRYVHMSIGALGLFFCDLLFLGKSIFCYGRRPSLNSPLVSVMANGFVGSLPDSVPQHDGASSPFAPPEGFIVSAAQGPLDPS